MQYYLRELLEEKAKNKEAGINLKSIGENLKIKPDVLAKIYENNEYYASLRTLEKLADYCNCELGDLVKLRPTKQQTRDKSKLDMFMNALGRIDSDLIDLKDSYKNLIRAIQHRFYNPSFGNSIEEDIRELLLEKTLDGVREKLASKYQQICIPIQRIPTVLSIPIKLDGDKLSDRYSGEVITDINMAKEILDCFLTARYIGQRKICENLIGLLNGSKYPSDYGNLVLVTAGYSSVVEAILRYMKNSKIEPTILVSIGVEEVAIPYEGISMWRTIKDMKHKSYVIGPHEFTRDRFEDTIYHFLQNFGIQGSNGYDIKAIFGFEGIRWDGYCIITSKQ